MSNIETCNSTMTRGRKECACFVSADDGATTPIRSIKGEWSDQITLHELPRLQLGLSFNPVSVPVPELNLSVSMPSRCNMLTYRLQMAVGSEDRRTGAGRAQNRRQP